MIADALAFRGAGFEADSDDESTEYVKRGLSPTARNWELGGDRRIRVLASNGDVFEVVVRKPRKLNS